MFITEEDYKVVVGETAFKTIAQANEANRLMAENEAMEEIACYLRPKYDCKSIFAAEGDERNRQIVMYTCDIALYHMVSSMPQKMGSEIRKERYDRAIKWLEGVQAGKIVPALPLADKEEGNTAGTGIIYSSQPQLRHNW